MTNRISEVPNDTSNSFDDSWNKWVASMPNYNKNEEKESVISVLGEEIAKGSIKSILKNADIENDKKINNSSASDVYSFSVKEEKMIYKYLDPNVIKKIEKLKNNLDAVEKSMMQYIENYNQEWWNSTKVPDYMVNEFSKLNNILWKEMTKIKKEIHNISVTIWINEKASSMLSDEEQNKYRTEIKKYSKNWIVDKEKDFLKNRILILQRIYQEKLWEKNIKIKIDGFSNDNIAKKDTNNPINIYEKIRELISFKNQNNILRSNYMFDKWNKFMFFNAIDVRNRLLIKAINKKDTVKILESLYEINKIFDLIILKKENNIKNKEEKKVDKFVKRKNMFNEDFVRDFRTEYNLPVKISIKKETYNPNIITISSKQDYYGNWLTWVCRININTWKIVWLKKYKLVIPQWNLSEKDYIKSLLWIANYFNHIQTITDKNDNNKFYLTKSNDIFRDDIGFDDLVLKYSDNIFNDFAPQTKNKIRRNNFKDFLNNEIVYED